MSIILGILGALILLPFLFIFKFLLIFVVGIFALGIGLGVIMFFLSVLLGVG
jgi:hypothetical protein